MSKLKILMINEDVSISYELGFLKYLKSILKGLEKSFEIREIWVGKVGGTIINHYDKNVSAYNVYGFKDGIDVLDKLQPDLVIVSGSYEFISRSLLMAAKHKKIPTVIALSGPQTNPSKISLKEISSRRFKQIFFSDKRTILKSYNFLMKTLDSLEMDFFSRIRYALRDFKLTFSALFNEFITDVDLYICSNPVWEKFAINSRVDNKKIVVVGEFAVDGLYKKMSKKQNLRKNNKIEVLFLTTGMVEHGLWSPQMRQRVLREVVTNFKNELSDIANLRIKIHPFEKLEEYQRILKPINPSIEIFHQRDLFSLLSASDVIITWSHSSALLDVLLLKKPLLIINMFEETHPFIEDKLALECTSAKMLVEKIKKNEYSKIDWKKREEYLMKNIFKFDGKCGQRAAEQIISLLNRNQNF